MPFGLCNSPATFQRLMDKIITPDLAPHCFSYLDDIIITSETFEEHLYWLRLVLRRLVAADLVINRDKSEFGRAEVKYLGFVVNEKGLNVDPDKIKAILSYPKPNIVREIRRSIGMFSWYRKFIPNYATIMDPIVALIRRNKAGKIVWGTEQQEAFENIKKLLVSAPILERPDFNLPFFVHTDASNVGLGAVLTQIVDEKEFVIAYASRSLNKAERNYFTTELECLAVIWAMEKFRPYVEGREVTVITDHSALVWLKNMKNPTGRLARWAIKLLAHNIKILHRKGAEHHVPDALSRMFERDEDEELLYSLEDDCGWYERRMKDVAERPDKFHEWKINGNHLFHRVPNEFLDEITNDGSEWKLVIPVEDRLKILNECHDSTLGSHLGIDETFLRIKSKYFWPKMYPDIIKFVRLCEVCQRFEVDQR